MQEKKIESIMSKLINELKKADESFTAAEWDVMGMRNFIQRVKQQKLEHLPWKNVIEQLPNEVNIILQAA